jgi:hypothetical protein
MKTFKQFIAEDTPESRNKRNVVSHQDILDAQVHGVDIELSDRNSDKGTLKGHDRTVMAVCKETGAVICRGTFSYVEDDMRRKRIKINNQNVDTPRWNER